MKFHLPAFFSVAVALTVAMSVSAAAATPASVQVGSKTLYIVKGSDPKMDTGNKVCASMGKACIGYSNFSNDACKKAHPGAKAITSVNGSKAGFYCDGAPQKGLACEKMKNTCEVCPACNVNADCSTAIGQQFREMYVECDDKSGSSSSKPARTSRSSSSKPFKVSPNSMYGPPPPVTLPPPSGGAGDAGSVTCTFSQKAKKVVTCGAVKAADTYCVTVMQSTSAKAIQCQDNGSVVCTLPCSAPGASNLKQCAFGGVKSGSCAAPKATGSKGTKKPGAVCQHGGECTTGNCIGIGPDYGKVYKCSCDPFTFKTGC